MELSVTEIFFVIQKVYKNRIMKFFKSKYRKDGKTGENQCFFSESQAE